MSRAGSERLRRKAAEQLIRRLRCEAYWGEMTSERRRRYARARILLDEAQMVLAGFDEAPLCKSSLDRLPPSRARLAREASGRPRLLLTTHSETRG